VPPSLPIPSHTHILLTRSPAPYSPFRRRAHSPTAFSGPMARPPLSPASSSLTHARRMDGFCNQNADQLGSLAGPSLLTVYVGGVACAPASLPPASSSLTHARRMDDFCNQNADQLGSLAGLSLLTVYVGGVACAPAPPTHTPPPHTGFPMSAHLSRLRLFQRHLRSLVWVWVWVWDWIHSHTPPRTRSPSSRHPPFTH
jgi:hypothetical protein